MPLSIPCLPEGARPLSFAQERLWFMHQYAPESPAYHIVSAFRLRGALDIPALEKSLDLIISRQGSLRTTFDLNEDEAVQIMAPHRPFQLEARPARSLAAASEEDLQQHLAVNARQPFDLARGPLFRFVVLALGEQDHILLNVFHHIIADGWSIGVYYQELASAYEAFATGVLPSLPPLPIQYGDYAVWQRQHLHEKEMEELSRYWIKKLAGAAPCLDLPADFPRPPMESFRGGSVVERLDQPLCDALEIMARREGVTLFTLLLAAFNVLLHRYTGQEDIVVGTPTANRKRKEVQGLIGFFVNTLALRTNLCGNPSFCELLQRARLTTSEALAHRAFPFEKLVKLLRVKRDASRTPLVQIQFGLQNFDGLSFKLRGLDPARIHVPMEGAPCDLVFLVYPNCDGWECRVNYAADLFERARIQRMVQHWRALLQGILESPECPINDLPMLTETEWRQILGR